MQLKRLIPGVLVIALIGLVGVTAVTLRDAPAMTEAQLSEASCLNDPCIRFPTVSGDNLLGEPQTYPRDFGGDYVLAVVPFDRDQQILAQSWLPHIEDLAGQYPDLTYYNIPVFPELESTYRVFARAGMIFLIEDEFLRSITTTVFLQNRDAFVQALDIPDVEDVEVLLMNHDGEVLWRERGEYDASKGAALAEVLATLNAR